MAGPGRAQTYAYPAVDILKATQQVQNRHDADADVPVGLLDGVHIGATWRM